MFGLSIVSLAIWIVVIAAVVALVTIGVRQMGVTIPPWVVSCFWVVIVAVVVIFCIRLVASI